MLDVIVGRAGSGKTHLCVEQITKELRHDPLGAPLYLLVPPESTFALEKLLLRQSGLGAITRAQVLGFQRLRWMILQKIGGLANPPLSDQSRRFLLTEIASQYREQLTIFREVVRHSGFLDQLGSLIEELMQKGLCKESLPCKSDVLDGVLAAKTRDLTLLFAAYQNELKRIKCEDSASSWRKAISNIKDAAFLEGAKIWIDGFWDFEDHEMDTITALLQKVEHMTITLRLAPDCSASGGREIFASSIKAFQKLQDLAEGLGLELHVTYLSQEKHSSLHNPVLGREERRSSAKSLYRFRKAHDLAYLEDQFSKSVIDRIPYQGPVENIAVVSFESFREEVKAIARFLVGQAREHGVKWQDMAVAVSDMDAYGGLLEQIFDDWDIPHFIDRPQSIRWHPLVVFLTGLFEIIRNDWSTQAVMQVLKSDLIGGGRDWVDELENYVLANGIDGKLWLQKAIWEKILQDLSSVSSGIDERMQDLGQIVKFHRDIAPAMQEPRRGRDLMICLWQLLEDLGIPERIDHWSKEENPQSDGAGTAVQSADHLDIWNKWVGLVDDFMLVSGDRQFLWHEFVGMLESGLANLRLQRIPPGLDQVQIAAPRRLLNNDVEVLVIVGGDESHLRYDESEDVLLREHERTELRNFGWLLESRRQMAVMREPLHWYSLFTRASKRLCITYSLADLEGKPQEPAPIIQSLCRIFPGLEGEANEYRARHLMFYPCSIQDAADLFAAAVTKWRENQSITAESGLRDENGEPADILSIYNWLINQSQGKRALAARLGGIHYNNALPPLAISTVKAVYGDHIRTNIHHVENMARCPFRYFASAVLRLEEQEHLTWDARFEGILWHEGLARFIVHLQTSGQDPSAMEKEQLSEIAEDVWQDTVNDLASGFLPSLKSYEYRVRRLGRAFNRVVDVLACHARKGEFRPIAAEIAFGSQNRAPWRVPLPDGSSLYLSGRIDCIEGAEHEGTLYVRVLDFKSGYKKLRLSEVYHGFSLQLLAYLAMLAEEGDFFPKMKDIVLAGTLYLPLHEPFVTSTTPLDAKVLAETLLSKYKMQGIVLNDKKAIQLMERDLEGRSSLLPLGRRKNGNLYKDSQAFDAWQVELLINYVKHCISQLGNEMLQGTIDIAPFREERTRACTYCPYPALCRFELGVPGCGYRYIPSVSDEAALSFMEQVCENVPYSESGGDGPE